MPEPGPIIVTYNGVDGACAAAMALLARPDGQVVVTSAARVGRILTELAAGKTSGRDVLLCGVGVSGDWQEVARAASALRGRRARLTWCCGRGYLDDRRADFEQVCEPSFTDTGTNTAAVCRHLGLADHAHARALLELARCDPHLESGWREPSEEQGFWMDLVNASIAQYFKYQDADAYVGVIGRLAGLDRTAADARAVAVFRRSGFRHVLWGRSRAMQDLRALIRQCAAPDESVLITGESGVGKEYVAHLIHERSDRAVGPFVAVNCGLFAGNPALANSTLFGHVRGAFTGAVRDRDGAFASADGGILFLDELAELSPEVQAKFLRVVEDGWVTPEGADAPRKVDVRVLAATNRSLPELIRAGTFRADLYHRLDTLQIRVPPLREHIEDVDHLVERLLPTLDPGAASVSPSDRDLQCLREYGWPGNVRQLIKVLKRAVYTDRSLRQIVDDERGLGELLPTTGGGPAWPGSADEVLPVRELRRLYAVRALELHSGNHSATARKLGVAVNTLKAWLSER